MWPQGRNTSTSLPLSVQLPHVIFGFHSEYFMQAISKSTPLMLSSPGAYDLIFSCCRIIFASFFNSATYSSIFECESWTTYNFDKSCA